MIPLILALLLETAEDVTNPIVAPGPDPWVVYHDGWYHFTATAGDRIAIRRARTLAGLGKAEAVTVWRAPRTGPNSRDIWAPEFHRIEGRWFLYYAATTEDRSDANRRVFVLESAGDDLFGPYLDRGPMVGIDEYAIDGTVDRHDDGQLYFLWSGREKSEKGPQNLYIARLKNPWTLDGPRVRISRPEHDWEQHGWEVNEGPEVLHRGGRTFVVYSASGFSTPEYCLGLLTHRGGDLLDPKAWVKAKRPVFGGVEGRVFGPGHNGFFRSPDGREDWILYHARDQAESRGESRSARGQPFTWDADGNPQFGRPLPRGVTIPGPSGEPNGR